MVAVFSLTAIIIVFTSNYADSVFKGISAIVGVGLFLQPLEMLLKHSSAGLNPLDPSGFLISCLVWVVYGTYLRDKTVALYSVLYACIYALTLILWWNFQ